MKISDDLHNGFSGMWIHYNNYEFKKTDTGEVYICPTLSSRIAIYNIFDVENEILIDILNIGRVMENHEWYSFNEFSPECDLILEFVRKYGLLGLMNYFPYNEDYIFQKKIYLPKYNDVSNETVLSANEYIRLFVPFPRENGLTFDIQDSTMQISYPNDEQNQFTNRDDMRYKIIASRDYCEKLDWFIKYAKRLYKYYQSLLGYYNPHREKEHYVYGNEIRTFKAKGIQLGFNLQETPSIAWDFSSLRAAIDMIFGFLMSNPSQPVKACKHDNVIFYAKNPKALFCSERCRNQYNVYKSRQKTKDKKETPLTDKG